MTEPAKNRTRRRLLSVLALVAVAGAGAAAMWFATAPSRRPPPRTMQLVIPSRTNAYTNASKMVISPDGTRVAFAASRGPGDPRRLWVRRLGDFDARELDTETNTDVFWSHDGRYIGFHDDGKLWSIRADGADKHLLALIGGNSGATWNADGAIVLAGGEQGLRILHTDDSSIGSLTRLDTERFETAHARPHFLPDGNRYLYLALTFDPDQEIRSRLLYAGDLATGEQTLIGPFASAPWYVEPGYLVYVEDGTVKAVPFDAQRLRITGKPSILAQDAYYFRPTGNASISASRTGETVYLQTAPAQRLVWFDTDGNRLGQVGPAAAYDDDHRISPDGQTVAVTFLDPRTGLADIMLFDLQRDMSRQLTFDAHWEGQPVWTPDGKTIYFSTDRHGWPDVFKVQLDGGAQSEVFRKANEWFPLDVSPNGRFLALSGRSEEAGRDIWIVPLDGENEPYAFSTMREDQRYARFSPDGTRIAYAGAEVYVDGFPDATSAIQVSSNGGFSPVWSPDGKKLYFGQRPTGDREWAVMSVEFDDSEARAPMAPSVLFTPGPFAKIEIAPDGERFLLRVLPDETPESRVILNWQSSLEEGATQ